MKYSKKTYRRIGTIIFIVAFLFVIGAILLLIASEGRYWFLAPLSGIGFFALLVLSASFQDKANHWRPPTTDKRYLGYMRNINIQLAKQRYYVSFDLVNQDEQIIKSQIRLLTRDKLLADSFTENHKISYSFLNKKKKDIWFPELHSKITMVN